MPHSWQSTKNQYIRNNGSKFRRLKISKASRGCISTLNTHTCCMDRQNKKGWDKLIGMNETRSYGGLGQELDWMKTYSITKHKGRGRRVPHKEVLELSKAASDLILQRPYDISYGWEFMFTLVIFLTWTN